jgi:CRISPR-associated protein Csb2
MTLVLEIEFLLGVCFSAIGPDSDRPDWPPQPDRIFSALVASWAARGERPDEARALEWLETTPAPMISASDGEPRTAPFHFVPPNDPQSSRVGDREVLPRHRKRQPRRFPAFRPLDPVVRLVWTDTTPPPEIMPSLSALAADTAWVGHSASLTRCQFHTEALPADLPPLQPARRRIYPGRLEELRRAHADGRRPRPGDRVKVAPEPPADHPRSLLSPDWLLLGHVGGEMPDIRATALVAKAVRDTLLSGYRQIGLGDRIPEAVCGHAADGTPSRVPHLAVIPLPFAGFPYADGHLLGFALVPPRDPPLLDDPDFLRVLRTLARPDDQGRRILRVYAEGKNGPGFSLDLAPSREPTHRSMDPRLFITPAQTFASVTPIVLDRHLKGKGDDRLAEISAQIIASCRHIGLPAPEVFPDKHSAVEGAPSAQPSGKAPAWTRWRVPTSLSSRNLTHAVIRFPQPVEGPILLGAGRYVGLGLCRPLDRGEKTP